MKILLHLAILFSTCVLASANDYPFKIATNETNTSDGLHISLSITDQTAVSTSPVFTVVFANCSTKSIFLLNHFASTAAGPALFLRDYDSSDPCRFQHRDFGNQIYVSRQTNQWITISPGNIYTYESPLHDRLAPGKHTVSVHYCVGEPADIEIRKYLARPDCPDEFWRGLIVSKPIEVWIREEVQPTGRAYVSPAAGNPSAHP
jgi:hypothetical protein